MLIAIVNGQTVEQVGDYQVLFPNTSFPASGPIHTGLNTFAHPATNHSQPTYTRTMSQKSAVLVFENKNLDIGDSSITIYDIYIH